jgi:hypothetical protein
MAPLQPLGEETHRTRDTAARPPRPARMRTKQPAGGAATFN